MYSIDNQRIFFCSDVSDVWLFSSIVLIDIFADDKSIEGNLRDENEKLSFLLKINWKVMKEVTMR